MSRQEDTKLPPPPTEDLCTPLASRLSPHASLAQVPNLDDPA
jgi:hypothetical protein